METNWVEIEGGGMNKVFDLDADVEFGTDALPDWRKADDVADADDEEMKETPSDVLMILGFDPKELF
jgi:hypothetical protein